MRCDDMCALPWCREGDLVTLVSRQDLTRALSEAVAAGESLGAGHGPRLGQQMLPALRVQVVECEAVRCAVLVPIC